MKKKIMVIPGAKAQIPLICKLQEEGYCVVCVNPYKDSPAFSYADICEQGDILDREFCLDVAKRHEVIAVLSDECDIAMPTVAYVSEKLGLPSIGSKLATLYTNKYLMREFCREHAMPYPKYRQCRSAGEAVAFFRNLEKKKMIIKPLDSNSSRGVFTIVSEEMVEPHFAQAIVFSKVNQAVLCEEYIEGTEFTVDGVVVNGKHYSLAISKKKHYAYNPNIACELYFSEEDEEYDYVRLREQNDRFVEMSGLPFGFTHAEYKYNGKEFVLIEIGARGGGNFISSHIVPNLTGIDNYKLLLEGTLGAPQLRGEHIKSVDAAGKCAVLKFWDVQGNGGKVVRVDGEDILKNLPQIVLYEFQFKPGDIIHKAENDSARVGFYIAVAKSREELDRLILKIEENVCIVLEGEDVRN